MAARRVRRDGEVLPRLLGEEAAVSGVRGADRRGRGVREALSRPATPGSTVFSNSSAAIVYQLQTLLPREEYNRLAQVASIHYPSPIPIIRAVVTAQNKDWGALFDQDATGFVSCLKRSTLFMRRSFSYRSFHIWSLC